MKKPEKLEILKKIIKTTIDNLSASITEVEKRYSIKVKPEDMTLLKNNYIVLSSIMHAIGFTFEGKWGDWKDVKDLGIKLIWNENTIVY